MDAVLIIGASCIVGGLVGFFLTKIPNKCKKENNIYKGVYSYPKSDLYKWTYKK